MSISVMNCFIKITLLLILLSMSFFVSAKDINCKGLVTSVMDYPANCDGNLAFITKGSNGKWICPASEKGNAILLTALAANKSIDVYIDNKNDSITCQNLPHYIKARYIILRK